MTASHTCPACGHQNRLGAKFCQKCGAHVAPPTSVRQAEQAAMPIDLPKRSAAPPVGIITHPPTLPLPARSPAPSVEPPSAPIYVPAGIEKTLMLRGAASPAAAPSVAAPYKLGPPSPARPAVPGWLWFLLGLLVGGVLTVAVLHYGPAVIALFS